MNGAHITFDNTGNKWGPCGPYSGQWGFGNVTALKPGWQTLTWEESISHAGSPFRIAILDETETARVILLDHIPHNDAATPDYHDESTYVEYKMTVKIPDVKCEKCSLQLLYVMTDKTVKCGIEECYYNPLDSACSGKTDPNAEACPFAPTTQPCVAENECFSNYHSCTDVTIDGSTPIAEASFEQPLLWPYRTMRESYYKLEAGQWQDGWLAEQGVPKIFTTYRAGVC